MTRAWKKHLLSGLRAPSPDGERDSWLNGYARLQKKLGLTEPFPRPARVSTADLRPSALQAALAPALGDAVQVKGSTLYVTPCGREMRHGAQIRYDVYIGDTRKGAFEIWHFTPELAEEQLKSQLGMTNRCPEEVFSKPPADLQLGDRALMFGSSPCWVRGSLLVTLMRIGDDESELAKTISRALDAYLARNEYIDGTRPPAPAPEVSLTDQTVEKGVRFSIDRPTEIGQFEVHNWEMVMDLGPCSGPGRGGKTPKIFSALSACSALQ